MTTSPEKVRVYNRRSKARAGAATGNDGEVDARDWTSLPPKLLEKVFLSLEVSDLQSAKETCGTWRAQVMRDHQYTVAASTMPPSSSSWTDTIESILQHLHELNQEKDVDVDVMMQFLVQEGIMKAP